MSEEELNQELSNDELKDVAGGTWTIEGNVSKKGNPQWDAICDVGTAVKGDLKTGDLLGKKGRKGKNPSVIFPGNDEYDQG